MTAQTLVDEAARRAAERQAEVVCRALLAADKACEFAVALARLAWVREQIAAIPPEPTADGAYPYKMYTPAGYQWRLDHSARLTGLRSEAAGLEHNLEWYYIPCGTCPGCEAHFNWATGEEWTTPRTGGRGVGRPRKQDIYPVAGGPPALRETAEMDRWAHYIDYDH
jgi:hypothetical protein